MSTYRWTLTDTSPDADPNGMPIAEGYEPTFAKAAGAVQRSHRDATHDASATRAVAGVRPLRWGHVAYHYHDGRVITSSVERV